MTKNELRKVVYVAGPLSNSIDKNIMHCVRDAVLTGDELAKMGFSPIIPHLTVFWAMLTDTANRASYEHWMSIDFGLVARCHAVYRMRGHSPGADREVELAESLGIPVFTTLQDLRKAYSAGELDKPAA